MIVDCFLHFGPFSAFFDIFAPSAGQKAKILTKQISCGELKFILDLWIYDLFIHIVDCKIKVFKNLKTTTWGNEFTPA